MKEVNLIAIKEILINARKLIEHEENWWDGKKGGANWGARDWKSCMLTAIGAAGGRRTRGLTGDTFGYLAAVLKGEDSKGFTARTSTIIDFNDTHSHREVLAAFDKAIRLAGD